MRSACSFSVELVTGLGGLAGGSTQASSHRWLHWAGFIHPCVPHGVTWVIQRPASARV